MNEQDVGNVVFYASRSFDCEIGPLDGFLHSPRLARLVSVRVRGSAMFTMVFGYIYISQ